MNNTMLINVLKLSRLTVTPLRSSSSKVNIEKLVQEESTSDLHNNVVDEEASLNQEALKKKCNKSRLYQSHQNILHEINPYNEPVSWHHETLKYARRTYGKYGQASGTNPGICWPTQQERDLYKEYESVAFPYTIMGEIQKARKNLIEKNERIQQRQLEVVQKIKKLEEWKQDLASRIQKKESASREARERKERLVEEVRAHFGYQVDPRDAKFKEMLEKKEKEQKKALKQERQLKKQDKMVEKIMKTKKEARNEPVEDNI